MSALKFEVQPCQDCGTDFDSLMGIWEVCDSCSTKRYEARMAEAREGRAYTIVRLGGACPTQAEGIFLNTRPYYFRARHGEWLLHLGGHGDPADYCAWTSAEVVMGGDDPTHGSMSDADVLAILDAAAELNT